MMVGLGDAICGTGPGGPTAACSAYAPQGYCTQCQTPDGLMTWNVSPPATPQPAAPVPAAPLTSTQGASVANSQATSTTAGTVPPVTQSALPATILGINSTYVLIGGAVLLFLMMGKK